MYISSKYSISGILVSLGLLAVAYFYFQQHLGLMPCPLCMLQRGVLVVIAAICILVWLHQPGKIGSKIYSSAVFFMSLIGLGVAARQVWLQHLPADKVPECGLNPIFRWLESNGDYGVVDMLLTTLEGSGDCAKVDWSLIGLSMAAWMMIIFSVFALTSYHVFKRQRRFFS